MLFRSRDDLDMLALEFKKLRGHLRDRLACLSLGVTANWRLEFALGGEHESE